jgi:hypothetical protein
MLEGSTLGRRYRRDTARRAPLVLALNIDAADVVGEEEKCRFDQ